MQIIGERAWWIEPVEVDNWGGVFSRASISRKVAAVSVILEEANQWCKEGKGEDTDSDQEFWENDWESKQKEGNA